jgi:hypothetical protein
MGTGRAHSSADVVHEGHDERGTRTQTPHQKTSYPNTPPTPPWRQSDSGVAPPPPDSRQYRHLPLVRGLPGSWVREKRQDETTKFVRGVERRRGESCGVVGENGYSIGENRQRRSEEMWWLRQKWLWDHRPPTSQDDSPAYIQSRDFPIPCRRNTPAGCTYADADSVAPAPNHHKAMETGVGSSSSPR